MGFELVFFTAALISMVCVVIAYALLTPSRETYFSSLSRKNLASIGVVVFLSLLLYLTYILSSEQAPAIRWSWVFFISVGLWAILRVIHKSIDYRRWRRFLENWVKGLLLFAAVLAVLVTFSIALTLIYEALRFFQFVNVFEFLFGTRWSPNVVGPDGIGYFGSVPLFWGTLLITAVAMALAIPTGLLSAIYLSCYASDRARDIIKPSLELLAGIPTVVYGFFAIVAVSPFLLHLGEHIGVPIASGSALGAGIVMGFMIIPYVASLSEDVLSSVPKALKEGSLALGATQSETIKRVVVPAALPGILASFLLAMSRAIGETMIVVMAAGYSARLTANPLEAVTTVTVQIVSLLTGDQEFNSPKTLAAFGLGLALLLVTLGFNLIAMSIVRHYREKYD